MSKLSNQNSRTFIEFFLNQNLNDLYSIFETEDFSRIKKIINVTIVLHSLFKDTQSKAESELIEHIKTFLPSKKNNEEKLKKTLVIYLIFNH